MNIAKKFKAVLFAFSILVLISVGVLFISNMSNAYAVDEAATNDQFGYIESGQDDNADANGQFGKHAKLKVFIENPANSNCTISVNKGGKIGYLSEGKYESIEIEFNYHCSFYINNEHTLVLMSSKNEITSANDDSFNIPVSESMYCEFKIMPNEGYIIDGDGWNLKKDNIPIDIASNLLDGRFLNDEEGFNKYSGGIFTPVVKPAAGFNGKVIDGSDPVAGANVQFTTSSGNTYSSVTDDNGMYRFDLPVYEGGTISVFKEGYKCSNLIVTAGEVESGDIDDINITAINNPVNIKGTVKGCKESAQAEKFNLPNAKLYFLIDNSPVYMSQADEDGNYSIQVENGDNGTL